MSESQENQQVAEPEAKKKSFFGPKSILIAVAIVAASVATGLFASGALNAPDKKAKANYEVAMSPIYADLDTWSEQVTDAAGYSLPAYKVVFSDLLKEHNSIQKRAEAISPSTEELKSAHKVYMDALGQQQEALKALILSLDYQDPDQASYFAAKATPHTDAAREKFSEYYLLMSLIVDSE